MELIIQKDEIQKRVKELAIQISNHLIIIVIVKKTIKYMSIYTLKKKETIFLMN